MLENYRQTVAKINLDNIYHNYQSVLKLCPNKDVIAVVKADAYGHGAVEVVKYLIGRGVHYFAVSLLEEAIELRQHFGNIRILIMGVISSDELSIAESLDLEFTVSDDHFAKAVINYKGKLQFHIKIDTGMNRMGFKDSDFVVSFMNKIAENENLRLEGIYTHFATSDSNETFYYQQLKSFQKLIHILPYLPNIIHVSNTSSALKYEHYIEESTHIRIGLSLYGLSSEPDVYGLKPAMTLKSKIVQIKSLSMGEFVGYGITYQAQGTELIGILPIGYADGLIRKNQNGFVEINQKRYQIIGRVCMDYTFVKIDDTIQIGDWVIIFGGEKITTNEVAQRLETITYEVLCLITKRVPRIYVREV